ncbi:MAG: class II aldolase/adducin family protein [Bryobacteraceae bacterium]|nr:class II aldolase/adducin family protein [Bryobacteraceae bacterium]
MKQNEEQLREDIVRVGRLCWEKGWVASNDGNISIRLDADRILCTPTGISKGMMSPGDLIIVDMTGRKIAGERACTSEINMHLEIYRLRSDVHAVVHCHPPTATGFAAAGRTLNQAVLPEVIVMLGCVPLAEYGLPGTEALTKPMRPLIPNHNAILLGNHGATCYGADVWKAYFLMETVEHSAKITLVAEQLGGPKLLPRQEVDKLFEARARYGVPSMNQMTPGCPIVAEDAGEEKITLTREELIALIDDAIRLR